MVRPQAAESSVTYSPPKTRHARKRDPDLQDQHHNTANAGAALQTKSSSRPANRSNSKSKTVDHQNKDVPVTPVDGSQPRIAPSEPTASVKKAKKGHDIAATPSDEPPSKRQKVVASDKRILRSQDGVTRARSGLAQFFSDYDEILFTPDKEPDLLNAESVLFITDRQKGKAKDLPIRQPQAVDSRSAIASPSTARGEEPTIHSASAQGQHQTHQSSIEWFDFTPYLEEATSYETDPLAPATFLKEHKRGERRERQLRNIEKDRAMHEKEDLERLRDELRGPDWLKVMGISGVTDTEKKSFEPKRALLISRVRALLKKFDDWRRQEKELKIKKEQAAAAVSDDNDDADDDDENEDADDDDCEDDDAGAAEELEELDYIEEDVDLIGEGGVDPSALQLLREANSAIPPVPPDIKARLQISEESEQTTKPFTSFFAKPYERVAALGKHRRGRRVFAFGCPLPEIPSVEEFGLPKSWTEEVEASTSSPPAIK